MSKIAEYKALEAEIAKQLAQLDALKNDGRLKKEIEFEEKLRTLLAEYGFSLRDVIVLLDPQTAVPSTSSGVGRGRGPRRERVAKTYINPHTNERVETKGGNHAVLKAWKAQYGTDVVDSWVQ